MPIPSDKIEIILRALDQYRGDNLSRAKWAWGNLTPEEMQKKHGQSDFTKQELMDSYQDHDDKVKAAIDWVKELQGESKL